MDLERLRTFYHVALQGGISEAEKFIGMNKSSISRQLSQLEEDLGVKLFDRYKQKLILTNKGYFLKKKAESLLLEADAIKSHLLENEDQPRGLLTLSTTFALTSTWLSHFIHLFLENYPRLRLQIKATNQPVNLALREADVAIRPYCNDEEDLIQKHLMQWTLRLFASPAYVDKFGLPTSIEELNHHRLIIFGESAQNYPYSYSNWPLTYGMVNGAMRQPYLMVNSVEGMFNLVCNGVGIGNFSENSPLFNQQKLVPILHDSFSQPIDVYYIYPKQFQNLELVAALEDFLFQYIKKEQSSEARSKNSNGKIL